MSTDINRLHNVLEGRVYGRRCGKTFALCHLMAWCIETGETQIDILLSALDDWRHMSRILEAVLREHRIPHSFGMNGGTAWGPVHPCRVRIFSAADRRLKSEPFPMWDGRRDAMPGIIDFDRYAKESE